MATTFPSDPLLSPTFTDTSASSFDVVSSAPRSRSSTISDLLSQSDSEEEIVWAVARHRRPSAAVESNDSNTEEDSEDDFVVLSRRRQSGVESHSTPAPRASNNSHPSTPTALTAGFSRLSLNNDSAPTQTTARTETIPPVTTKPSTQTRSTPSRSSANLKPKPTGRQKKAKAKKRGSKKSSQAAGLGERPIVDDFSEMAADDDCDSDIGSQISVYDEAVQFITLFLTNPDRDEYNTTSGRLTLLQSIIIELGLSTSVPSSVTSAKAILKSQAFVNVREYLAVREQGLEALQGIMHPSRSALARSIKKSRKRVSLQWVKEHGLDVFLVPCYRH